MKKLMLAVFLLLGSRCTPQNLEYYGCRPTDKKCIAAVNARNQRVIDEDTCLKRNGHLHMNRRQIRLAHRLGWQCVKEDGTR
jgi:hypothetical protein